MICSKLLTAQAYVPAAPASGISLVGSVQTNATTTGTQVFNLPAGTTTDDVVIVFGGRGTTGNSSFATADGSAAGYTELYRTVDDYATGIYYKVMGATPDTSVDVGDFAVNNNANAVLTMTTFRGVNTTTPIDAQGTRTVDLTGLSDQVDFGFVTTITDNAWVLALADNDEGRDMTVPTGYTTLFEFGTNIEAAFFYKEVATAGLETPSDVTMIQAAKNHGVAFALRPA